MANRKANTHASSCDICRQGGDQEHLRPSAESPRPCRMLKSVPRSTRKLQVGSKTGGMRRPLYMHLAEVVDSDLACNDHAQKSSQGKKQLPMKQHSRGELRHRRLRTQSCQNPLTWHFQRRTGAGLTPTHLSSSSLADVVYKSSGEPRKHVYKSCLEKLPELAAADNSHPARPCRSVLSDCARIEGALRHTSKRAI